MPIIKAIPKKRSGRLLVVVRDCLYRQLKFEAWLKVNHPLYYDQDIVDDLNYRLKKLDVRIHRALIREYQTKQLVLV